MKPSMIPIYLHIAGIREDDSEWGLQYNLCHGSLSDLGVRSGLDHRVKSVLQSRGLGAMTESGRISFGNVLRPMIETLNPKPEAR